MNRRIYKMPSDFSDGKTTIKKDEYVMADYSPYKQINITPIETLDGKRKIEVYPHYMLRPCPLTLKENELLIMHLHTGGWSDYYCIGTNPYTMWKRLIQLFNYSNGSKYNINTIKGYEFFCDFYIPLRKINSIECFADSTDTDMDFLNKNKFEFIGDYKEMYYGKE